MYFDTVWLEIAVLILLLGLFINLFKIFSKYYFFLENRIKIPIFYYYRRVVCIKPFKMLVLGPGGFKWISLFKILTSGP